MKLSELKQIIRECIDELNEGPARDYRKLHKTKIKDVTNVQSNVATEPNQAGDRLAAKRARRGRPPGPQIDPEHRVFNYSPAGGRKPGLGVDIARVPKGAKRVKRKSGKNPAERSK